MIKDGTVKMDFDKYIRNIKPNDYGYGSVNFPCIDYYFDFSSYESDEKIDKRLPDLLDKINKEAVRISDELMLGSASDALKALNKFASMKL